MTARETVEPTTHYWLWPLAVIHHDDVGWLVVVAHRWTIRVIFGTARRW